MTVNYIITDALRLCAENLIPSVFPFMVLTNLLISCGFEDMVKTLIKRPFEALFHLNANLASAYILGIISGYPQGAYAITEIYEKGGCTKDEAQRALAFCNNTGPAFMISAIGTLFGNVRLGWSLFFMQLAITLLYGILTRPKKLSSCTEIKNTSPISLDIIPKAVTSSVVPMLNICGFVVIFAILCYWVSYLPLGRGTKAFIYAVLEISNAVKFISRDPSLPILCFSVIWSGICVHMQTASVVGGRFSMKRYYVAKALQSLSVFLILYLKKLLV